MQTKETYLLIRRRMNTSLKTCFKCGHTLPRSEFYGHPRMGDGLLGKCKSCCKQFAKLHRLIPEAAKRISDYERARFQQPDRRAYMYSHAKDWSERNPHKKKAQTIVANAIRCGRLVRQVCEKCNTIGEAHHSDYSKPLEVRWLCRKHHMELHRKDAVLT